jgi:protein-S-isoprenylcysteine O-methyltransferase Ste14
MADRLTLGDVVCLLAPRNARRDSGGTTRIGAFMVASGLGFTVWARLVLGRNWSGRIAINVGQQLVRTGPYRWIRHPIYTGGCAALGHKIRVEEHWLMREFGDQYREYRRSSWRLVPFVL